MNSEEFAAKRRKRFAEADDEVRPLVRRALRMYGAGQVSWAKELVIAAAVLWLETYAEEAPHADPEKALEHFKTLLANSFEKTKQPDSMIPTHEQVERITLWLGTVSVNDATWAAVAARGGRFKRWVTMHDRAVRETHALTDGQLRPIGETFDVAGHALRYPGDPVGPPEIWINCRCLIQPVARTGEANVSPTTFAIDEDVTVDTEPIEVSEDDLVDDELEDDEEEVTEIPVHGVLAPEGIPTGDGRQFATGSLSHRELPLPIAYQVMSAEGHNNAVTVGRIDTIERVEGEMRFTGALMTNRQYTPEVIQGIVDGTVRGISVDVDNIVLAEMADQAEGEPLDFMEFSEARIAGVTIVPIPAFQEAYIGLGHEFLADLPEEAKMAIAACGDCAGPEEDDNPDIEMGYDAYREVDAAERKRLAGKGEALPDGSFPIANVSDLKNAIQAIGRAKDPAAAKAHIKKRARALGHPELIPEGWGADVIDLTDLTEEELAAREALSPEEQDIFDADYLIASAFAPGTKDGPGWITHPIPTARIRRYWTRGKGAAKIRWGVPGDFNRCRRQLAKYIANPEWLAGTCANMHKEALGFWPGMETGRRGRHGLAAAGTPAPMFTLVASGSRTFDHRDFERVELDDPRIGVDIVDDHIFGYVAQWGVCHIGIAGVCTTAPYSGSDYWYFATGLVDTDVGAVRVGQITMDTGHAGLKASAKVAAAHYDNTGAAVADIAVGEDGFGIWFSGVLRPTCTEDQRHALRASGRLSGDWRWISGGLEMVAALAVNVPGLPIPQTLVASADGHQITLIAAGVIPVEETFSSGPLDVDTIVGITRTAVAEYRHQEKREQRVAPLREALRERVLADLRAKIGD